MDILQPFAAPCHNAAFAVLLLSLAVAIFCLSCDVWKHRDDE